jgi:hypothetical protein
MKEALTALQAAWYTKRPLVRSTAPKIVRRRLLPGVRTGWRCPMGIQVARTKAAG